MTDPTDHDARQKFQIAEANSALIAQANASHADFTEAGALMGKSILRAANAMRETGLCLIKLKEQTPRGRWDGLFASARGKRSVESVLHFDLTTGGRYMSIARNHPEQIRSLPEGVKTLKELLIAIGALPEPERGQQRSHGQLGPFAMAETDYMGFWSIIGKEREKRPASEWPEDIREHWIGLTEPVIALREELIAARPRGMAAT